MAGDAVPIAPVSNVNSLLTGNFTGNRATSGLRDALSKQETAAQQRLLRKFPRRNNRENYSINSELFWSIRELLPTKRYYLNSRRVEGSPEGNVRHTMVPLLPLSRLSWPPSCWAKPSTSRPPSPESARRGSAPGGVVTIGDFAPRRVDLD